MTSDTLRVSDLCAIAQRVNGHRLQEKSINMYRLESNEFVGRGDKRRPGKYAADPFPSPMNPGQRPPRWLDTPEQVRLIEEWFARHPPRRTGRVGKPSRQPVATRLDAAVKEALGLYDKGRRGAAVARFTSVLARWQDTRPALDRPGVLSGLEEAVQRGRAAFEKEMRGVLG